MLLGDGFNPVENVGKYISQIGWFPRVIKLSDAMPLAP